MPTTGLEIFSYLVRWFSFAGPVYVLYKIPEWGLSFINIFGVMSGVVTVIQIFAAMIQFKGRISILNLIAVFFYFPYTILLNLILISGVIRYSFSRKRYFH